MKINKNVRAAFKCIAGGGAVDRETARRLVEAPFYDLLYGADRLRERSFGGKVSLCAIVNAKSGLCGEDCAFCAQSARHRTGITVYPLKDEGEITARAYEVQRMNACRFGIVTSGRGPSEEEMKHICDTIRNISRRGTIALCASLGALTNEEATALRAAGLTRYHHNLECSASFYPRICATHRWEERIRTVKAVRNAGMEVCSGGLFGLGEGWDERIDLALTLRELGVTSVPLNFLVPVTGTPLENNEPLSAREALTIIALFRFMLPKAEIRVAGGREHILGDLQSWIFYAGASGMMISDYLTTKGRNPEDDVRMITMLGLNLIYSSTSAANTYLTPSQ